MNYDKTVNEEKVEDFVMKDIEDEAEEQNKNSEGQAVGEEQNSSLMDDVRTHDR